MFNSDFVMLTALNWGNSLLGCCITLYVFLKVNAIAKERRAPKRLRTLLLSVCLFSSFVFLLLSMRP